MDEKGFIKDDKILSRFILIISLLLIIFYFYATWDFPIDDAYISFRYARNFAEGNGLVYNIGERVEGYSNFFWVILNGVAIYFGANPLYFSTIFSAILYVMLLVVFWKALWKNLEELSPGNTQENIPRYIALFGIFLLAVDMRFFIFISSGLETQCFITLFFISLFWNWITTERWSYVWFISLALLCFVRADGFIYAGIIILAQFINLLTNKKPLKKLIINTGILLIILSLYSLWRWLYYHDILPNTYYAKTSIINYEQEVFGIAYTLKFLSSISIFFFISLIGLFTHPIKKNIYFLVALLLVFLYVTYIGGDWMPNERFYLSLIPVFSFFAVIGAIKIEKHIKYFKLILLIVIIVIVIFNLFSLIHYMSIRRIFHLGRTYQDDDKILTEIGLYIKANSSKDDKIAVNFAGIIPYYSERYTIDMTGLNDKHIAKLRRGLHKNWDVDYVLSKKPLYVTFYSKPKMDEAGIHFVWGGSKELYYHPLFQKNYSLHKVWLHPVRDVGYYLFKRNDNWNE